MNTLAAIQSFLQNRQALNRSSRTVEWYECHLNRFATEYPELPMDPEPIEAFLAQVVPDGTQDELRHAYYRSLKAFYRHICKRKRLPNPIDFIDPPTRRKKVKPTLKAGQMFQLLNRWPRQYCPRRHSSSTALSRARWHTSSRGSFRWRWPVLDKQLSIPGLPIPEPKEKKPTAEERLASLESRVAMELVKPEGRAIP